MSIRENIFKLVRSVIKFDGKSTRECLSIRNSALLVPAAAGLCGAFSLS